MIFTWFTRRRRAKLQAQSFPSQWRDILHRNVLIYTRLADSDRTQLERRLQVFIAEKNWEGVGGLTLTDEMRVTISGLACFMVLGIPDEFFDNVLSILVYPASYIAPDTKTLPSGIVIESGQARMGEAWYRGPVILSWSDVLAGGREQTHGLNLVFHEFAHQLDMQNGRIIDGTPPLPTRALAEVWPSVMEAGYQQLLADCRGTTPYQSRARQEAANPARRAPPLLDCYGTTNRAEFFAVATETYFTRPAALSTRHPELFDVLRKYYRSDPRESSRYQF